MQKLGLSEKDIIKIINKEWEYGTIRR
jgi:hypothetical protein